jgi:hypothetical protein
MLDGWVVGYSILFSDGAPPAPLGCGERGASPAQADGAHRAIRRKKQTVTNLVSARLGPGRPVPGLT